MFFVCERDSLTLRSHNAHAEESKPARKVPQLAKIDHLPKEVKAEGGGHFDA